MWPKNRPTVRLVKHKSTTSLREATQWAIEQITTVTLAHKLDAKDVGFTLEYLDGGLQGWHVRYSSESEHWQRLIRNA